MGRRRERRVERERERQMQRYRQREGEMQRDRERETGNIFMGACVAVLHMHKCFTYFHGMGRISVQSVICNSVMLSSCIF